MDASSPLFRRQICQLLSRGTKHKNNRDYPLVRVAPSSIPGAGRGVCVNQRVSPGTLLCLYPGIYSPGLPFFAVTDSQGQTESQAISTQFFGKGVTPSGVDADENAYILNVQVNQGGYLDGKALTLSNQEGSSSTTDGLSHRRRLDENPHACGQLVNHSSGHANVDVKSFVWNPLLDKLVREGYSLNDEEDFYPVPNAVRADGLPRYIIQNSVVCHNGTGPNCGAVLYARHTIQRDQELFFDYKLRDPLPSWAKDWYK